MAGGRPSLSSLQDLHDRVGLERLFQHRQHVELMLQADRLDVLEHGGAAVAHQLHGAAKAALAERHHRFDGVGRFERDVVEDQIGEALVERIAQRRAVGAFDGVDANAVQHQRQEVPDARLVVDDIAERNGARRKRRRLDGSRGLSRRRRRGFSLSVPWNSDARIAVPIGVPNSLTMSCPRAILHWRLKPTVKAEIGDPGRIRTCDPQLRRLVLYPAELRGPRRPGLPGLAARGKVRSQRPSPNPGTHDHHCRSVRRRADRSLPPRGAVAGRGGARRA